MLKRADSDGSDQSVTFLTRIMEFEHKSSIPPISYICACLLVSDFHSIDLEYAFLKFFVNIITSSTSHAFGNMPRVYYTHKTYGSRIPTADRGPVETSCR